MDHYTAIFTLGSILSFIGTMFICIAGILLLIKQRSLAAILVFVGSLLLLLLSVLGLILPIIAGRYGSEEILWVNSFLSIARGFSFLVLSIGLLILIINIKKAHE